MFCPSCGTEESHSNQFCRACGTDLRVVRLSMGRADSITSSAVSAREEIGRAVAQKLQTLQHGGDIKVFAENVLPEIEKFLESPEEKRMRRIRTGSIISFIGLGATIAFSIVAYIADHGLSVIAGLGLVTLFIGISFVINGLFFTVPKKIVPDNSLKGEKQRELDGINPITNELVLPESNLVFASVAEETTRQLQNKQPVTARKNK